MRPQARAAVRELMAAYENPHLIAGDPRLKDRPLFGCLTPHVPLELIHAAQITPVRVQSARTAPLAAAHLQSYTCGFARAAVHGILGDGYDYLDGILAAKTCDVGLSLFQICQNARPARFSWLVSLPGNCDPEGVAYLREEFAALGAALEAYRGAEIPRERLHNSIALYNDLRTAVLSLWRGRDQGTVPISGGDLVRVLKGVQVTPPETALNRMHAILSATDPVEPTPTEGTRLLLIGNSYADAGLVDMLDGYGARVVYEDTTSVGRYFGSVIEAKGDPLAALAEHYASSVTGCYRLGYAARLKHIEDTVKDWDVDACINVVQKFCDTSLFEAPLLDNAFREWGIPCLMLEIDDASPGLSQIETRVQAFLEMLGGIQ